MFCGSCFLGCSCQLLARSYTGPVPITFAAPSTDCGGWYKYTGYCYQYFSTAKNFLQAEQSCFAQGATLLSILTADELNYIKSFIRQKHTSQFYLGLNDRLQEGVYVWDDATASGVVSSIKVNCSDQLLLCCMQVHVVEILNNRCLQR